MHRLGFMALGAFTILCLMGTVPNPFPYSPGLLQKRTIGLHGTVTAGATAATESFANGVTCKGLLIVNEGSNPARICPDAGTTPTSTVGILLAAGASFTDSNWSSNSFAHIRTGGSDTTLRYYITYSNE